MSPPAPAQERDPGRMDTHVKVVGALIALMAIGGLIGGGFVLISGDYAATQIEEEGNEPETADMVRSIMRFTAFVLVALGAIGIIGAVGLFILAPWGRVLSLIACAVGLVFIPFGTAVGIYGLVILSNRDTALLFERGRVGA